MAIIDGSASSNGLVDAPEDLASLAYIPFKVVIKAYMTACASAAQTSG